MDYRGHIDSKVRHLDMSYTYDVWTACLSCFQANYLASELLNDMRAVTIECAIELNSIVSSTFGGFGCLCCCCCCC